jgi:serine/threonine protein kinase
MTRGAQLGSVYRARDTRLGRDVALKVLPEVFSRDTQRMARFEREAKVLASLNHPNITAIYGLEELGNRIRARQQRDSPRFAPGEH